MQDGYENDRFFLFTSIYTMTLGDRSDFQSLSTSIPWFLWIIYLFTSVYLTIIMLNLLISIIGDSYDKIMGIEERARNYEKLMLVLYNEKKKIDKKLKLEKNNKYLFALGPSNCFENGKYAQKNDEGINRIREKVENIEYLLKNKSQNKSKIKKYDNKEYLEKSIISLNQLYLKYDQSFTEKKKFDKKLKLEKNNKYLLKLAPSYCFENGEYAQKNDEGINRIRNKVENIEYLLLENKNERKSKYKYKKYINKEYLEKNIISFNQLYLKNEQSFTHLIQSLTESNLKNDQSFTELNKKIEGLYKKIDNLRK